MYLKDFFPSIIPKKPLSTKWLIKSDKSERGGKSDINLINGQDFVKAKVKLHYLNGQDGPVGFITFRRKCRPCFKLGLSLNIFCKKGINLAIEVKSQSDQLFLFDIFAGPEQKIFYIPWKNFYASQRGKRMHTNEKLKAKNIKEVGILIQRSKQKKEILYEKEIIREIILRPTSQALF